jgi:hypothetical protein
MGSIMDNAFAELGIWTILSVLALGVVATLWALGRIQRGWISSARRGNSRDILCNAPGRIARFRIGCLGNVKGFELDSGIFAKTPPELGGTLASLVPPQTKVLVSGYFKQSGDGATVMDARLIIVGELGEASYSRSPYSQIYS